MKRVASPTEAGQTRQIISETGYLTVLQALMIFKAAPLIVVVTELTEVVFHCEIVWSYLVIECW
jgi:hypothetical protein